MNNKYRKSSSAVGKLDNYAIRAEEYASYIARSRRPPQVTLERIANLAEKAINYQHTRVNRHGKTVADNRPIHEKRRESQRTKVLDRIWKSYEVVLKKEVMHSAKSGLDESWNSARKNSKTGKWESSPVMFYGDQLDHAVGDELHGYKAQGRTPIRDSNYNGDEGGEE